MRRRLTVLVSVLGLTVSMFLPAATGPVLAKGPNLDVRGTWKLKWTGRDGKTGRYWHLAGTAVIKRENLRTGAFTGDYDIPEQPIGTGTYPAYHNEISGKVQGHKARIVGIDGEAEALTAQLGMEVHDGTYRDGRPPLHEEILTLEASQKGLGIRLDGYLAVPAPPQSLDGGDRTSETSVDCMPTLGGDGASYRCLVSVADDSSSSKPTRPTGQVTRWTGPDGRTHATVEEEYQSASACDLAKPTDGARYRWTTASGLKRGSYCLLDAVAGATAAAGSDGNVPVITVEYAGDKHFGPSEASWFAPGRSAPATPDAGATDPLGQLIDLVLQVGAMDYQMQLDIGGALEP